jgi:hypothetical protein
MSPSCRVRLQKVSDDELVTFGIGLRNFVYPLRYGFDGKPVVSVFSIQLDEARAEWRRRSTSRRGLQTLNGAVKGA